MSPILSQAPSTKWDNWESISCKPPSKKFLSFPISQPNLETRISFKNNNSNNQKMKNCLQLSTLFTFLSLSLLLVLAAPANKAHTGVPASFTESATPVGPRFSISAVPHTIPQTKINRENQHHPLLKRGISPAALWSILGVIGFLIILCLGWIFFITR